MAHEHILVVEDEADILELIRYNLTREGYRVTELTSGEKVLETARRIKPSLILLDLMLPGIDGFEVCRRLQHEPETQALPVVILTARSEDTDMVAGLELGADDYITKPFSPRVLIARLRAVLRRHSQAEAPVAADSILRRHNLEINPGRHEALIKGKPIELTFTEFRILHTLASRPGWVFSREQIVDAVRGEDYAVTERSVDVQIVGLRKKLGTHSDWIETVRGVGYRFTES